MFLLNLKCHCNHQYIKAWHDMKSAELHLGETLYLNFAAKYRIAVPESTLEGRNWCTRSAVGALVFLITSAVYG